MEGVLFRVRPSQGIPTMGPAVVTILCGVACHGAVHLMRVRDDASVTRSGAGHGTTGVTLRWVVPFLPA